jgi:hypothetical protein
MDMIEGMALPEGALDVQRASMVRHAEVYWVVTAVVDTPGGQVTAGFLHAPADQEDLGNGGQTWPLDDSVAEWAPFATMSDDAAARELTERLIAE